MSATAPLPSSGEISWVCHPARHRPLVAALTAALVAVLCVGVHLSFSEWWLTGLAVVALWGSVAPFYLPTGYLIAQDGVTIRTVFGTKRKDLSLTRRFAADRHGVLLSPFDHPSRLDRFHGLNLRFDAPDRDRVIEYLSRRFPRHDGKS